MAKLICQSLLLGLFCIVLVSVSVFEAGATLDFISPIQCLAVCTNSCMVTCNAKGFPGGACIGELCCCS
ncbi:unnamed protein product [Lathyrus oleraceus]